ncbi:MAG: hypothetical protein NTZ57_08935 [Deltaproteobacteria bacterium]|nr:hypothetical protein [Deltaproteobacteria bacterium]
MIALENLWALGTDFKSVPRITQTLVKGEKDGGVFPGLGAEDAVHDIQVLFSKKVEGGPEFLPVPVLDAFVEQQIGKPDCGLLTRDLADLRQNDRG